LQVEREERERQQQLEQSRVDRLLDEAASLRHVVDIRAYVEAVKTTVADTRLRYRLMRLSDGRNGRLRKPIALIGQNCAILQEIEADSDAKINVG
jgi:hypothetical protein